MTRPRPPAGPSNDTTRSPFESNLEFELSEVDRRILELNHDGLSNKGISTALKEEGYYFQSHQSRDTYQS